MLFCLQIVIVPFALPLILAVFLTLCHLEIIIKNACKRIIMQFFALLCVYMQK